MTEWARHVDVQVGGLLGTAPWPASMLTIFYYQTPTWRCTSEHCIDDGSNHFAASGLARSIDWCEESGRLMSPGFGRVCPEESTGEGVDHIMSNMGKCWAPAEHSLQSPVSAPENPAQCRPYRDVALTGSTCFPFSVNIASESLPSAVGDSDDRWKATTHDK